MTAFQCTFQFAADSLEKLWREVEGDFERWGFYAEGGEGGPTRQGGVFRTNCIDCLDRTNVVQVLMPGMAPPPLLILIQAHHPPGPPCSCALMPKTPSGCS